MKLMRVKDGKSIKKNSKVKIVKGSNKGTFTKVISIVNRERGLIKVDIACGKYKKYNRVIPKNNVILI